MKVFKFAQRNIQRTPYQAIAAVLVMFLTFLILISFMIIALGSQRILQYYESKPQAIAFFKDEATAEDVAAIQNALRATGKVVDLKYVTKDEALTIYQDRNQNNPTLLELVTAKILPSSLEISTYAPSDLANVAEILKQEPVVEEVVVPEDVIQHLTNATSVIRSTGLAVVILLSVFSFFILLMIIGFKIRIRRNEIETMRLLGASNWFIRLPFIIEGIVYGVFGGLLAYTVTLAAFWYVTPMLQSYLQGLPSEIIPIPLPWQFLGTLLLATIIVSTIIGSLGSFAAVRRYLKL